MAAPAGSAADQQGIDDVVARETGRKAIHVGVTTACAALAWYAPAAWARALLAAGAVLGLALDLARLRLPPVGRIFQRTVGTLLRGREQRGLTGATTMAIGFAATALVFPTRIAAVAFLYAGLADAAAALVGRSLGRHRFRGGKSVEGSIAFFLVALVLAATLPGLDPLPALGVAVAATLVEALPVPDDNWINPLAAAGLLWLGWTISG